MRTMIWSQPTDDLLNKVFSLAYFILGDRTSAIYVAQLALDKLKTAATVQDRRLYYLPTGRSLYPATRTKVNLSHVHLLQRLVYAESESFERLLEAQGKSVPLQDMIIRFVKHLVRVTTKHNSFYVALGLARVLHNYTTADTAEIYNLVIQDPDRGRDDYYYRSRKKYLLRELKERFGKSLVTYRGYRGEERFEPQEHPEQYVQLVKESLLRFTPWESLCLLPANIDPSKTAITPFLFRGKNPDEEHEIELNRIHSLLHPDCFERLVLMLGLDAPAQRLEIPRFSIASDDDGSSEERLNPERLSNGELDAIRRGLEKTTAHRKIASKQFLMILVDGTERTWLDIKAATKVQINLEENAELIEVRSMEADDDVCLAIHPLSYDESGIIRSASSIRLGIGRRLFFTVKPLNGSNGPRAGSIVSVKYHERRLLSAVTSLGRKLAGWLSNISELRQINTPYYLKLALGTLLLFGCTGGLLFYLLSRSRLPDKQLITTGGKQVEPGVQPSPAPSTTHDQAEFEQAATPSPPKTTPPQDQTKTDRTPQVAQRQPGRDPGSPDELKTRGRSSELDSAALVSVRLVYVDPLGDAQFRDLLITKLQSNSRLLVVETRDQADAVFKGAARRVKHRKENVFVTLRLVNVKGQEVWSTASRRYSGNAADVAQRLVTDLLANIQEQEQKR